ncbi:hypothetical protein BJX68DRAFT_271017 [Aspergillus pseudodeflectus]|uniref:Ig-like domain-containing protein n=1 Tax=Aspergillus pseudodeflectus TaxID=176178 RepID=A0ABR4JP96_9EURO
MPPKERGVVPGWVVTSFKRQVVQVLQGPVINVTVLEADGETYACIDPLPEGPVHLAWDVATNDASLTFAMTAYTEKAVNVSYTGNSTSSSTSDTPSFTDTSDAASSTHTWSPAAILISLLTVWLAGSQFIWRSEAEPGAIFAFICKAAQQRDFMVLSNDDRKRSLRAKFPRQKRPRRYRTSEKLGQACFKMWLYVAIFLIEWRPELATLANSNRGFRSRYLGRGLAPDMYPAIRGRKTRREIPDCQD